MKRWLGLLGWLLAGLAAAAAVFLFLVLQPFSLFSIHNSGASPKTPKVVAAERTVWKGDLPAGATRFRLSIVDRDTDIALTCYRQEAFGDAVRVSNEWQVDLDEGHCA